MAVFRCEIKTLKRAAGRSAVAAAAYRAACRLRDEQANEGAGKVHDYRRRAAGVVHIELLTPDEVPAWAGQRGRLWNEAERAETRKNSVTARELVLSLPHELDDGQRIDLVRGFAARLVDRYGVAVDLAIHQPDRQGDHRNHHAHLMMTTRRLGREGFTEKTRELDDMKQRGPQEVEAIRVLWELHQNRALERAGLEARVSCLSNKERGIDREPEPKIGEAANALLRRGEASRRGTLAQEVRRRNTLRENMTRQAERRRSEQIEREKREAVARALEAARAAQSRERTLTDIANALLRDTSEAQRGRDEAADRQKEEARKLDEERQRQAERAAFLAWQQQRQEQLRREREARDQANENEHDLGRVMERDPPKPDG